jgi:Domain of unknown function (DUF4148)
MNGMQKSLLAVAVVTGLALSTAVSAKGARDPGGRHSAGVQGAAVPAAFIGEDSGSFELSRQPWVSTRTRAEVVAELQAAQRRGEVAALTCEDSGSSHLARGGAFAAAPLAETPGDGARVAGR